MGGIFKLTCSLLHQNNPKIDGPLNSFLFSETCFLLKMNSSGKSATAVTLKLTGV